MASGTLVLLVLAFYAGSTEGVVYQYALSVALLIFGLTVLRQTTLILAALRERTPAVELTSRPLVSIIVPAYNESAVIYDALVSLAALDWPDFEIIVVDDGSVDETRARAEAFLGAHPDLRIRILSQPNSGKAAALNSGLAVARGDFFLCVDADSRVQADVITRGMRHFSDPRVAAVGGFVEVANDGSLLTRFQALEYMLGLNFVRRAFSWFGAVTVVPGPVGLFRRQALAEAGGYREGFDNFAEDADLTVRLLAHGWIVKGDLQMIARTEAPTTLYALLRQRYRWKRGFYQAIDSNLFRLITAHGARGPIIAVVLLAEGVLLDLVNGALGAFFISRLLVQAQVDAMLAAYAVLVALDLVTWFLFCGSRDLLRRIGLLLVMRFSYAPLLQLWHLLAMFDEWRSRPMDWDKLERLGVEERT